jgi:hypothetical protein
MATRAIGQVGEALVVRRAEDVRVLGVQVADGLRCVRLVPPRVINSPSSIHRGAGPKAGNFHQILCKYIRKWVGILCHWEAKGAGRKVSLAPLS